MKNKLAYSELTKTVYFIDGRGNKINVTDNFNSIMQLIQNDALEHAYEKGYKDATREAIKEIHENYRPNDLA